MSPFTTRSVLVALAVLTLSSCRTEDGDGRIVTEQRPIAAFSKLEVDDGITVTIFRGPPSVSLTTDSNLLTYFDADVDGDTLKLRKVANFTLNPTGEVLAEVSTNVLEGLEVKGGSRVSGEATSAGEWRLSISGGSTASIQRLDTQKLIIDAEDSSYVEMFGNAREVDVEAGDNSQVSTERVTATDAEVKASGGSIISVYAITSVRGQASGSSRITVFGNPPERDVEASGNSVVSYGDEQAR